MRWNWTPPIIVFYSSIPLIVAQITIFIILLIKLYGNVSNVIEMSKFQKRMNFVCFILIVLTSVFGLLHSFVVMRTNAGFLSKNILSSTFHTTADVFYNANSIALYIILFHRLYSVFNETVYGISKWFIAFVIFMIILQIITMIAGLIMMTMYEFQQYADINGVLIGIIVLNDYILNGLLFAIFILKLRQLVFARLNQIDHNDDMKHVSRLLDVAVKQTIIGMTLVIVNQTFATLIVIQLIWGYHKYYQWYLLSDYITRGVEGFIVCCLLYLGLAINKNAYSKICGKCHKLCMHCFVNKAKFDAKNTKPMKSKNSTDFDYPLITEHRLSSINDNVKNSYKVQR